jgi:predicted PurR-regulated permease PerM
MDPKLRRTLIRASAGLALGVSLIWLMVWLESVTTMLMVAFIFAYLLDPAVQRLDSWGLRRSLSALLMLVLAFSVVTTVLLILIPKAFEEISSFSSKAPYYFSGLQSLIVRLAEKLDITLPQDWQDLLNLIGERGRQYLPRMAELTSIAISLFFKSTFHIISTIFFVLLIPIITYYLLVSFDTVKAVVIDLIPPYVREPVLAKLREIDLVLSGFVRGQLTIAFLLGIFYTIGFLLIGIDLAVVLGVLSGVLWIIPYVGTLFGLVTGSLMALAKYGDIVHVLYVIGWIAAVQLVEGYLLTPRIVGHAVGLHPVVYMMALIVGANMFGFVGLLVAIPVTAVLKVLLMTAIAAYQNSYLYHDHIDERPAL